MKANEYAALAERETSYWWHLGRLKIIQGYISRAIAKKTKPTILNVGSGTGGTIAMLESFGKTDNVETSDEAIAYMQRRGYANVIKARGISLPIADKAYDMIGAFDVLEHIDDDVAALREWKRVLKDDGCIIITIPAYQWLWSAHDVTLGHVRRYTTKQVRLVAEQAGLQPVRISYALSFSLPLVVGGRLAGKVCSSKINNSASYVDVPHWLNTLLTHLLYLEARLHQYMNFPAGTSVIAVLKKPGEDT